MEQKKIMLLLILVGFLCMLVVAPILGFALNRITTYQSAPEGETTDQRYDNDMQAAFHSEFALGNNQRAIIKVSVANYQNISCRIMILAKAIYNKFMADNTTINGENGLRFIWGNPEYADVPGSGDWLDTLFLNLAYTATRTATIEFMGDSDTSSNLISIPGTYYVVIQGANDDPGTSWTANEIVTFDVTVSVQGPGRTVSAIFVLIGFILVLLPFVAFSLQYIKDFRGGRR